MYRQLPLVVVLPETVEQVSAVMALANEMNVKVVPRGAGTSLSGGSLPLGDGILLGLSKFNQVLEVDYANRCARVQPGVTNLAITKAVEHKGFYYAPDPSSQIACSIGGNVGENSGGVHCLKYGLTTNNLLGLEIVLMDGEVIQLGGKHLDSEAYDLMGLMTGSEGLLGIITEVTVRILQKPQTVRGHAVRFPDPRRRRQLRRRHHRSRHHSGRPRNDGQAWRSSQPTTSSPAATPRRRKPADLRTGRHRQRSRSPDRARLGDREAEQRQRHPCRRHAKPSDCNSGPAARTPSQQSAQSDPTTSAWTAPSRASS